MYSDWDNEHATIWGDLNQASGRPEVFQPCHWIRVREMRLATLPELCRTMNRAESEECIDDCLQYDIHHT